MKVRYSLYAASALMALSSIANAQSAPCGEKPKCDPSDGVWGQRLQDAWGSPATTAEQRQKMREFIDTNTMNGTVNWEKSASAYFTWRNGTPYDLEKAIRPMTASAERRKIAQEGENNIYRNMRLMSEEYIKRQLVDPSSATFEWPYGFIQSTWKPDLFAKKISGQITCGYFNSRNRMGGFSGRNFFVVIIDGGRVIYSDIDNGQGVVDLLCQKAAISSLPPAQKGMRDEDFATNESANSPTTQKSNPIVTPADRLKRLESLFSAGIINKQEYEDQRRAIISSL